MLYLAYMAGAAVLVLVLAVAWSIVRNRLSSMTMRVLRWIIVRIEWKEDEHTSGHT